MVAHRLVHCARTMGGVHCRTARFAFQRSKKRGWVDTDSSAEARDCLAGYRPYVGAGCNRVDYDEVGDVAGRDGQIVFSPTLPMAGNQKHDDSDERSGHSEHAGDSHHPTLNGPEVRRRRSLGRLESLTQSPLYSLGVAASGSVCHEGIPRDSRQNDHETERE